MKRRRLFSSSCGEWNTHSWVGLFRIRYTARHVSMMGLCLFFSSMADSKSALRLLELAFRIVCLWIEDVFLHSTTHIDHIHPSVHDVSALHGFGQLFVIRRSHRTCTSHFLRDFYSSHHSDENYDVYNRSSPWCTRSALKFLPFHPSVCHSRCKATHFFPCYSACISEDLWIGHTYP